MLKVIVIENLFSELFVELIFSIWFSIIIFSYRAIHLSKLETNNGKGGKYRANHVSYIDVGDGCWRPNVLVTSLRCW